MSRPRPKTVAWRAVALAGLASLTAPLLAACGGSDEPESQASASPTTDAAVQQCREEWRALGEQVEDELTTDSGDDEVVTPSGLRARWVTVTAQISYYASSGTAGDCEETLAGEQDTIAALEDFSEELAPLDVELALSGYERSRDITSYARPSGREGRAAPSPKQVETALRDLRRLAPQATADQAAGWQQASVTDLADAKARDKAVADLEVLSGESAPYRKAQRAIAVLDRAIEAVGGEPVDGRRDDDEPRASGGADPSDEAGPSRDASPSGSPAPSPSGSPSESASESAGG